MGFTVQLEQSALTPQQFQQMVNEGAANLLVTLGEFCDQDAMPQLIILEVCRRHLTAVIERGLAMDELALAKFRSDIEQQFQLLKPVNAS